MVKYISNFPFKCYLHKRFPDKSYEDPPLELEIGEYSIGRGVNNKIVVVNPLASRHHCTLFVGVDGSITIKDLGSTNGTFVGGDQIESGNITVLADGDFIGIGGTQANEEDESIVFKLIKIPQAPINVEEAKNFSNTEEQTLIELHDSSSHTKSSIEENIFPKEHTSLDAIPSTSGGIPHISRLPLHFEALSNGDFNKSDSKIPEKEVETSQKNESQKTNVKTAFHDTTSNDLCSVDKKKHISDPQICSTIQSEGTSEAASTANSIDSCLEKNKKTLNDESNSIDFTINRCDSDPLKIRESTSKLCSIESDVIDSTEAKVLITPVNVNPNHTVLSPEKNNTLASKLNEITKNTIDIESNYDEKNDNKLIANATKSKLISGVNENNITGNIFIESDQLGERKLNPQSVSDYVSTNVQVDTATEIDNLSVESNNISVNTVNSQNDLINQDHSSVKIRVGANVDNTYRNNESNESDILSKKESFHNTACASLNVEKKKLNHDTHWEIQEDRMLIPDLDDFKHCDTDNKKINVCKESVNPGSVKDINNFKKVDFAESACEAVLKSTTMQKISNFGFSDIDKSPQSLQVASSDPVTMSDKDLSKYLYADGRSKMEVDETIQSIYKRRLSHEAPNIEKRIPTTDKIKGSFANIKDSSSIASESFTVDDDDIVIINDDEDFPCSQRLDIKPEPSDDDVDSPVDYYQEDQEEDEDSEDSSMWFEKLSQCPGDLEDTREEINHLEEQYESNPISISKCADVQIIDIADNNNAFSTINEKGIIEATSGSKRKSSDSSDEEQNTPRKKILLTTFDSHHQSINENEIDSDREGTILGGKRKINVIQDDDDDDISKDKNCDSHVTEEVLEHQSDEQNKPRILTKKQTARTKHRFKTKRASSEIIGSIESSQIRKNKVPKLSLFLSKSDEVLDLKTIQARFFLSLQDKFDEVDRERSMDEIAQNMMLVDIEERIMSKIIENPQPLNTLCDGEKILPKTTKDGKKSKKFDGRLENEDKRNFIPEEHKLTDYENPLTNSQKLVVVNEKIAKTIKKKPIQLTEAKNLTVRGKRKSEETATGIININKVKDSKDKWLSKPCLSKINPPLSKNEKKAIIKKKLKDINKAKESTEHITEEQPKSFTTAKNTTKITSKSRNAMLIDTLVSSNDQESRNEISISNSLRTYKIPRRPSTTDESVNSTSIIRPPTALSSTHAKPLSTKPRSLSKDQVQLDEKNTSNYKQKSAGGNLTSSDKIKSKLKNTNKISGSIKNDCYSLVDQILTCKTSNADSNIMHSKPLATTQKVVVGVENEEPFKVEYLSDVGDRPPFDTTTVKPILKTPGNLVCRGKNSTKKVKFCRPGQENILYVMVREMEINDDAVLKPLTKNVTKKEPPPPRKKIELNNMIYTKYTDEILFQICKWSCKWFEEREKGAKGEPPVYTGQVYHLKDHFTSYQDYRQSMLPLLLYELWQSIAKFHCQTKNKNNSFNITIKEEISLPVKNNSIPLQKDNERRILSRLDCQALLYKENQTHWPRQGDLLVLYICEQKDKSQARRVMAYLVSNNIRSIKAHKDVSPKLVQANPGASQVMDFILIVRESVRFDVHQEIYFNVLKNIKSELRQFDALDCLSSSPLLNIILQPKENTVPVPQVDIKKAPYRQIAYLNTSQKKAVVSVAKSIIENQNIIQFVHGPPGCGKSEVIIGIILQILSASYHKEIRGCPKILLCAPSNAAIDDIFLRLMNIRQNITNMPKFKMVRIGRTDTTHKNVSSLTLDFLVGKEIKKTSSILEDAELKAVELSTYEAKKNQLEYQRQNPGQLKGNVKFMKDLDRKYAEILEKIKELEKGGCKKYSEGKEWREHKKDIESTVLEGADIIATTLSSCYNAQMENAYLKKKLKFTCCIVDEATQCTETETLIPLMMSINTLVLVGDPMQLPATVISEKAKACGFQRSLFARQWQWWMQKPKNVNFGPFNSRYHFLNVQYRMHPDILKWPSHYFYNNEVKSHENLLKDRNTCCLLPYVVLSHEFQQSIFEDSNHDEAKMIVTLVQDIIKNQLCEGMTIGIITGYNKQKDQIQRMIENIDKKMFANVEIGTVDSYQGREQDIILLSCVRTDGVGFMTDSRLNVAVTRARHALIICGNFTTLKKDDAWKSLIKNAKSRGVFKFWQNDSSKKLIHEIIKPEFVSRVV